MDVIMVRPEYYKGKQVPRIGLDGVREASQRLKKVIKS